MAGANHDVQFHLTPDSSKRGIGGTLFQLVGHPTGTEGTDKLKKDMRFIMFMSFKLADVESRYSTTEREALAIVRCLAEVRWLVIGSPYPVKVYTDHVSLLSLLSGTADAHGRVARWMDRLSEYDFEIYHRPNTTV